MAEEVRLHDDPVTEFILEQPRDPAEYRSDTDKRQYMSMFRTDEWRRFQEKFKFHKVDFDQGRMGHERCKPTTLFTSMTSLTELHGLHGPPKSPPEDLRGQPLERRIERSKMWATWAPGLKLAIATAIKQQLQVLECKDATNGLSVYGVAPQAKHYPPQQKDDGPQRRNKPSSVQSHEPFSVQSRAGRRYDTGDEVPPGDHDSRPSQPKVQALSAVALEQWRRHFLNDHMPARRDCVQCVRAQARSKPHKRVQHAEAFTLSVDLSGKLSPGDDQGVKGCRYILVGCYTMPVTRDKASIIPVPGREHEEEDKPLPGLDEEVEEVTMEDAGEDQPLPEEDELMEDAEERNVEAAKSMCETWHKLVEEATNVAVKQITFVEPVRSRAVKHVLPALGRIYCRLRSLGLPLYRLHSDRAREFCSEQVRSWTLARDVVTTMTPGSSYKANGRVESEMNMVKKSIRTLISAQLGTLTQWPLIARHIGERRLRAQLQLLGWPVGRLLKFGATAFALRKSWQARYAPWREVREEVTILGPDMNSSLTNTGYLVQSKDSGRRFSTDDIIIPDPQQPGVEEQVLYLPERADDAPARRQRRKAIQPVVSMFHIEGEERIVEACPDKFEPIMAYHPGTSSDSWTMESSEASEESSPKAVNYEEEEWIIGGGDVEGAPNSWDGGSRPTAPRSGSSAALRALHVNLTHYVEDEMTMLDGTSEDQALWIGPVTNAIKMRSLVEEQLVEAKELGEEKVQKNLEQEFLVTKTVGNMEVWANLKDWEQSIRKEYDQLVTQKCAVRQITKQHLQQLSSESKLPIELLPAKMVHTRKAYSGAYRSRAVVCGNYAGPDESEHYAGGVDGNQIRTMLRLGAMKSWTAGCTDIRTAFLNAPRRDETRLMAMEIPIVFKKLGLADSNEVWLIDKAIYGLTTSPRDWSLYRDEVLPTIKWHQQLHGRKVTGRFQKNPDENVWRLEETDHDTGKVELVGLMSVYVDDLLIVVEEATLDAATQAVSEVWAISDVEKTGEGKVVKYCGFEVESALDEQGREDGFIVSQKKYEKEMIQRFEVEKSSDFPRFHLAEGDDMPVGEVLPSDVKKAQSMAGALLWLSTRTRPDIAMAVATACRLCTKNALKSIEVSNAIMQYVHGNQGGLHYPRGVPAETWGKRNQPKIERSGKLLEVFSDISFGAGSKHRSLQGLLVCFAGVPIGWQSSQQAFVTHSTAESELVGYCEALNVGRSMEAMICAMIKEQVGTNAIERVIYGDNAAAISMAHGTGTSSWRTRHLRVRSSYLKEALDGTAPGGLWRLLHLRGTELVADGLTKPLQGQSFARFVQDLGMNRKEQEDLNVGSQKNGGGGQGSAAIKALVAGSLLLSQAKGSEMEEAEIENVDWVFIVGTVLMALGAVYAGQLVVEASKCCLKRFKRAPEMNPLQEQHEFQCDGRYNQKCGDAAGSGPMRTSSMRSRTPSGSGASSCQSMPSRSGTAGASSIGVGESSCQRMPSRSGTAGASSVGVGASSSQSMPSRSGTAGASSTGVVPTSKRMTRQSGSSSADGNSACVKRGSNSGKDLGSVAGKPATVADVAATSESIDGALDSGSVGEVSIGTQEPEIRNPWNVFQHAKRQRGLNSTALSRMYKEQKSKEH